MIIEKPGVYETDEDGLADVYYLHESHAFGYVRGRDEAPAIWSIDGTLECGDTNECLTHRIGDLPGEKGEADRPEKCQPPAIHVEVSGIAGIGKTGVVRIIRDALLKHARVGVILEPDYSETVDLAGPPEPTTPVYIAERAVIPGDLPREAGSQVPVEDVRQMRDDDYWHGYDAGYKDGHSGKQKRERKDPETFADLPGEEADEQKPAPLTIERTIDGAPVRFGEGVQAGGYKPTPSTKRPAWAAPPKIEPGKRYRTSAGSEVEIISRHGNDWIVVYHPDHPDDATVAFLSDEECAHDLIAEWREEPETRTWKGCLIESPDGYLEWTETGEPSDAEKQEGFRLFAGPVEIPEGFKGKAGGDE